MNYKPDKKKMEARINDVVRNSFFFLKVVVKVGMTLNDTNQCFYLNYRDNIIQNKITMHFDANIGFAKNRNLNFK